MRHIGLILGAAMTITTAATAKDTNDDLVALFEDWRAFETPATLDGAPDYTAAAMAAKHKELAEYKARLTAFDTADWPIPQKVDYHLLRAEMNGLDFNIRVLKPWVRDPAYYVTIWTAQSDTPAHEGPTNQGAIELWTYYFPLSSDDEEKLAGELAGIPPLLAQARGNLTGNARDLWISGIGSLKGQSRDLAALAEQTSDSGAALADAIAAAREATDSFIGWLEDEAPSRTGPSGIGKENYSWALKNVHLIPMTWEDEVTLLKRELGRAHAALRLEEQRNRDLPPLQAISSPEEFTTRTNAAASKFMDFMKDNEILPIFDYMYPALRAQLGEFMPEAERNFFAITYHLEPLGLISHFYHWWDLAQVAARPHPDPIRRGALLYNIWDSRAEGMATAWEEMMMHAGLYDDNPRGREIVWIMLAQRAARGLGSLYAHANEFTMKEAADFHVKWTPRGWMSEELDLLGFEQQLYLRQPGYGTSYVTGKNLIERLIAEVSRQKGEDFRLYDFLEEYNEVGLIPVSLIRWQMTGLDDEIRALTAE